MNADRLIVSETFYSIQGEGKSAGTPAVFLRLAGCNLRCSGFSYVDPLTQEHLGCDSKAVWRVGEKKSFDQLLQDWHDQGWLTHLNQGAHLIVTGGEPLIQQVALYRFLTSLDATLEHPCFIEMETNITLPIHPDLLARLNQINASPKLSNSGEDLKLVYTQLHIETLVKLPKVVFKFVISHPRDAEEVLQSFVIPFNLPKHRVYLMAEGGTNAALDEKEAWLVDICKEQGYRFSPRLHIRIWGEVTGV